MRASLLFLATVALSACDQGNNAASSAVADGAPKFSMPLPSADADPQPDAIVATWEGGQLTYGELLEDVNGRLIKQEIEYLNERYTTMRRAIDSRINEALLEAEATKRGLADAEALVEQLNAQNTTVTEAEINEFYEQNKRRFRGRPLEQVKEAVEGQLTQAKQREAVDTLVEQLRNQASVDVALEAPELPRLEVATGGGPARGAENAPITIIEFADYECPYCTRGYTTMKSVMEKYDGKVKWYFRDFPLSFHRNAVSYSVAANCAGQQGKYWEMHDAILDNQKALTGEGGVEGLAKNLGLDEAAFGTCIADKDQSKKVMENMADGQAVGVTGTPAYFINGIMISGAQPLEAFEQIIDRELETAGQAG
jgi:predicted DsbA family dithiol-disulfide isomerase